MHNDDDVLKARRQDHEHAFKMCIEDCERDMDVLRKTHPAAIKAFEEAQRKKARATRMLSELRKWARVLNLRYKA